MTELTTTAKQPGAGEAISNPDAGGSDAVVSGSDNTGDQNAAPEAGLYVAIRRFTVANGMTGEVKAALINRPRFVDGKSGFLRMDVISPVDNPDEVIIMTYWASKAGYDAWYKSTNRRESEQFIPKGLKVVPGSTSLTFYEHVCS